MADHSRLLSLSIFFLFLIHSCFAQIEQPHQFFWQNLQRQQQHRLLAKTSCRIERLNAQEPSRRIRSEAGVAEYWDSNSEEFGCAGIEFARHEIEPRGLLLPHYTNAPRLIYIVQGSGIQGTVFPGCAETYESSSGEGRESEGRRGRSEEGRESEGRRGTSGSNDRHQKLRRFRQGDVLALPQGVTHWTYNDGDTPVISVSLLDVANENNQLDLQYRKFFLAGNPQGSRGRESERGRGESQESERERGQGSRGQAGREQQYGQQEKGNIFNGFDEELLGDAFNVDSQIIRQLSRQDNRGTIVRAERLQLVLPEQQRGREEQEFGRGEGQRGREQQYGRGEGQDNGFEETFCALKLRENIDHPARADIYNPRGGRISTVNSQTLPILSYLRLSAEKGVLYRNAIRAPHWTTNAHSAMYVTRGSARIQVVGHQGRSVFNEEVNQGQLLIIPQNFVVIKRASSEGFEWISLKTNDNAMNSELAGRLSAIRSMPVEVLMNSYGFSRQDAQSVKYNRNEALLFSAGSRTRGPLA